MPDVQKMKEALQAYIDRFNACDAQGLVDLYAEDGTVEDPVGTPIKRGKQELQAFYTYAVGTGAKLFLDVPIRGSHGNAAAMAFTVRWGEVTVRVIDVMTFDENNKITSMKAYFAPEDMLR